MFLICVCWHPERMCRALSYCGQRGQVWLVESLNNHCYRLASSPRQNSHMQCQTCGREYNVISPTTPGAWILLLSGTKKHNSVLNWCLTKLAANTAKEYPRSSLGKESVPRKRGHRPHHQACLPPVLQIKKRVRHWPEKRPKRWRPPPTMRRWQFELKCPN